LEVAKATNLPLMMHGTELHRPLVGYLKRLRKGDVFTHCFHMYYSEDIDSHIFLPNGKIKPEAIEARERGVIFDTANANSSINFEFNEKAMQQGFLPDSISTNLTLGIEANRIYDLPTTVSRYLAMGMDLDTAVKLVTVNPAHQADFGKELGTLRPGTTADISVWDLREGNFEFIDGWKQKRMGHQMLVNKFVLTGGRVWANYMGNYPKDTPWTYTGSTG
jgi:dihydroorotase